ncbi:hypothetical protein [Roseibium alexandrii]|uniref:hypothetical protein n=1 Tax=Roseibium alexandrii TaxID=388408 RepID=UPI0037518B18
MKAFIPISVGNPVFTRDATEKLIARAEDLSQDVIIVVCDSLRIIANRLRSDQTQQEAITKARKATDDTIQMLKKLKTKSDRTRILKSSEFCEEFEFKNIEENVRKTTISNDILLNYISAVVLEYMRRIQIDSTVKNTLLETEYVLHETAISIYCTSVLKYNFEIYKDGGNGFIDYFSVWCKENMNNLKYVNDRKLLNWSDINMKTSLSGI